MIASFDGAVDLVTKISMDGADDYTLVYHDFKLDADLNYQHTGGECPQGTGGACANVARGPQLQHTDVAPGATYGTWFDGACCCSSNNGFGWYGSCGFGQFGFVADGSTTSGHGGKFFLKSTNTVNAAGTVGWIFKRT